MNVKQVDRLILPLYYKVLIHRKLQAAWWLGRACVNSGLPL